MATALRPISISKAGVTTSALGFGCSALLGPISRKDALRILHTAYDCGIRHFDVARVYGTGDAESVLGEFIETCQDPVTVTSKFGLKPPKVSGGWRFAVSAARRVMRVSPRIRSYLGAKSRSMSKAGVFSVAEARSALETSLSKLRLNQITCYLLHECTPADCTDELQAFLEGAVAKGQIGAFGVGTSRESVNEICRTSGAFSDVVQLPYSASAVDQLGMAPREQRTVIFHGVIGTPLESLSRRLAAEPQLVKVWSDALDVDCSDKRVLAEMLLNHTVAQNPTAIVLFRSTKASTVRFNIESVAKQTYASEQLQKFAQLLGELH